MRGLGAAVARGLASKTTDGRQSALANARTLGGTQDRGRANWQAGAGGLAEGPPGTAEKGDNRSTPPELTGPLEEESAAKSEGRGDQPGAKGVPITPWLAYSCF
jgi:hypothetical protein